ncbi:MAG: general secretion pathway protein GspB [Pseudomonadota bacterium]
MSLILDALNRAERDKRQESSSLDVLLTPDNVVAVPGRTWVLPVTLLLAGVLAVLAFLLGTRFESDGEPVSPGSDVRVANALADPVREGESSIAYQSADSKRPQPPSDPAAAPDVEVTSPPADTDSATLARESVRSQAPASRGSPEERLKDVADTIKVNPQTGTESGRLAESDENDARIRELYAQSNAQQSQVQRATGTRDVSGSGSPTANDPQAKRAFGGGAQETVTTNPATPIAQDESINLAEALQALNAAEAAQTLQPHPAPMLADLSKQFRDSVPTLLYRQHMYDSDRASTVVINGATLRAGGRTKGVEVREILPDSVILRYQGTDFRLRSLNSWVNL